MGLMPVGTAWLPGKPAMRLPVCILEPCITRREGLSTRWDALTFHNSGVHFRCFHLFI